MISIRVRILLLAVAAVVSVSMAFYFEYQDIRNRQATNESSFQLLDEIDAISKLIHSLQKERGLSAGKLIAQNERMEDLYKQQLVITDFTWTEIINTHSELAELLPIDFHEKLSSVRQKVDSNQTSWFDIRGFYSTHVQTLLDEMQVRTLSIKHSNEISSELQSISYLAMARENLGLARAVLNRGYQRGKLSSEDLSFLASNYGAFLTNYRNFELISEKLSQNNNELAWLLDIKPETFQSVIEQIEIALVSSNATLEGQSSIWWNEATFVIDLMKKIEVGLLNQIENDAKQEIQNYRDYLFWYGVISFSVLLCVIFLTAFTVNRILKALSILLQSLHTIEETEDYAIRIQPGYHDEFGQLSYSINSLLDYTDKLIKDKEFLATTDLLTNVNNRRSFISIAEKEFSRCKRYETPLSLIYCDIDFFKSINDKYGHKVGDQVLIEFANILSSNLRLSDALGRWGGEEFIILAPNTNITGAYELAEKLRTKVMELKLDPVEQITSSFGVAELIKGESFTSFCERADRALYRAKETGRNKVCTTD